MIIKQILLAACALSLIHCQPASTVKDKESLAPEFTSQVQSKKLITSKHYMVSAANPHAAKAGQIILAKGGSAIDAAVAIQMVLNVVEPQSSGIGGGLFALYFDNGAKKLHAMDGRETAPRNIKSNAFLKPDQTSQNYFEALVGGQAVGTPGALMALWDLHQKFGKLEWKVLFEPAIKLATEGFKISPRLHNSLKTTKTVWQSPDLKAQYFDSQGKAPLPTGHLIKNKKLAHSFTLIAEKGIKPFYKGLIAKEITDAVKKAYTQPGTLDLADLSTYQAKFRNPICKPYRSYKVCGMPPPTSGGVTLLQILGLLESYPSKDLKLDSPESVHLFLEASKLAYADRGLYLADPDFVKVPTQALISNPYLENRVKQISKVKVLKKASPGNPTPKTSQNLSPDESIELPSTTHFSIVDSFGNAVSITSSIEYGFGSTIMAGGFILNNQLTDFSFTSLKDGKPIANRIEPLKRPRSSMAPTMIFDEKGDFLASLGSPGGSRIIEYVAKTIVLLLDAKKDIQQAISSPHFTNRNGDTDLEIHTKASHYKSKLEALGHKVNVRDLNSGLHGIVKTQTGYNGGADPRREGIVLGDKK